MMKVRFLVFLIPFMFTLSCKIHVPDITDEFFELIDNSKQNDCIGEEMNLEISWDSSLDSCFSNNDDYIPGVNIIENLSDFNQFRKILRDNFGKAKSAESVAKIYIGKDGKIGINHEIYCNLINVSYESNSVLQYKVLFYELHNEILILSINVMKIRSYE